MRTVAWFGSPGYIGFYTNARADNVGCSGIATSRYGIHGSYV